MRSQVEMRAQLQRDSRLGALQRLLYTATTQSGSHESSKKWMRAGGARTELWMRLRAHIERMHIGGQFNKLDEAPIWRGARKVKARLF